MTLNVSAATGNVIVCSASSLTTAGFPVMQRNARDITERNATNATDIKQRTQRPLLSLRFGLCVSCVLCVCCAYFSWSHTLRVLRWTGTTL